LGGIFREGKYDRGIPTATWSKVECSKGIFDGGKLKKKGRRPGRQVRKETTYHVRAGNKNSEGGVHLAGTTERGSSLLHGGHGGERGVYTK
jgi:hypothetical protein